jgi:predicted metal-dependent phosphoesterase TrpH
VADPLNVTLSFPGTADRQSERTRGVAKIDLHTHSARSDGTDTPTELVHKAKAAGLTVLGLTDHDTTSGWAEASAVSSYLDITLVHGIELSVENDGQGHHLLVYEPDPQNAELREMLVRSVEQRDLRIPLLVEQIARVVPALQLDDVLAIAGTSIAGRPHVAEALIRCGASPNRPAAFAAYLVPGCPTYVETWSPPIQDAIRIANAAGGVAVIAHPWGRNTYVSAERFHELKAAGLSGIEVDHQEHDAEARRALRLIARDLGLIVTGSSDYHGTRKVNHELGCNTTSAEEYERLSRLCASTSPTHLERGSA